MTCAVQLIGLSTCTCLLASDLFFAKKQLAFIRRAVDRHQAVRNLGRPGNSLPSARVLTLRLPAERCGWRVRCAVLITDAWVLVPKSCLYHCTCLKPYLSHYSPEASECQWYVSGSGIRPRRVHRNPRLMIQLPLFLYPDHCLRAPSPALPYCRSVPSAHPLQAHRLQKRPP